MLKKDPKDFSLKEIKKIIDKKNRLDDFYPYAKNFAKDLGISDQNLQYYAKLVSYYSIYKLSRISSPSRRLFLACFIHIRHEVINDNLVKAFLYRIDKYVGEGKQAAREVIYRSKVSHASKLRIAGE